MSARRTFAAVAAQAADHERDGCIRLLNDKIAAVDALARRKRVTAAEAMFLQRRLRAVIDDLAAGLHRASGRATDRPRGCK